jgi:hypothetical protein
MVTFNLWAVVTNLDRIEQVDQRLSADQKFEPIGWGPWKRVRFEEAYERLFPDRVLRRRERLLWLAGGLSLAGVAVCIAPFI